MVSPWIANVSQKAIKAGDHPHSENTMLIQICNPPGDFPTPKHSFQEVHQFQFLDVEETDYVDDEEMRCSPEQAAQLVALLQRALTQQWNVLVHCYAGVCRSGAVVEVGVMLGFHDLKLNRSPNLLVKHRMLDALGLEYDPFEPHSINGQPIWYDELNNIHFINREQGHAADHSR
jgi:hypothetical protein